MPDLEHDSAPLGEWRPIATAPNDGKPVLVWWPMRLFRGAVARKPIGGDTWEITWNGDQLLRQYEPTHWMPIPPPPTLDTTEGGAA